jgi:hypothetical protein
LAIKVTLNTTNQGTRISSRVAGTINDAGLSFWDPVTGTNLNPSNPTSGDLTSFTNSQLTNIANAIKAGVVTVTTGAFPSGASALAHKYAMYATFASAGSAGTTFLNGSGGTGPWSKYGITGVAAADSQENNW